VNKKKLFRKVAGEAIRNSHIAIKNCWMILFTGGTVALLNQFDRLTGCVFTGARHVNHCSDIHLNSTMSTFSHWYFVALYSSLIFVYFLTFYRFYVGNVRVFDIRYDEVFKFITSLSDKDIRPNVDPNSEDAEYQALFSYSDVWIKKESVVLMLQTFLVIYLALLILHPLKFMLVYLLVLFVDCWWIAWSAFSAKGKNNLQTLFSEKFFEIFGELKERKETINKMFPSGAMSVWHKNNSIFAIILLPLVALSLLVDVDADAVKYISSVAPKDVVVEVLFALGAISMLANCAADLWRARTFYSPLFGENHRLVVSVANGKAALGQ
jgi:hypothetical protein